MIFRRSLLVAAAVLSLGTGAARAQQPSFDIVGLKLGMTESEVIAALKAHDATLKIQSIQSAYGYTDGVSSFQTEPFLSRVEGHAAKPTSQKADFIILFTPPPQGGRVWAIERQQPIATNQPTQEQYAAALKEKYGPPTATSPGGAHFAWDFPAGKPNCIPRPPDRPGFPAYRPGAGDDLNFLLNLWQKKKLAPADLSTCASRLHYVLSSTNGQVISSFTASLIDVAAYATSNAAANRQVQALEEKVRKEREGKGQAPKL
ncbi:MAG: hypothetical protein KIT73_01540 [Burkholderiales bacterium]|nr:hypothetical protein [Burkholderiales bacterium]